MGLALLFINASMKRSDINIRKNSDKNESYDDVYACVGIKGFNNLYKYFEHTLNIKEP